MFENKEDQKTPISEIGEFKLIERITAPFSPTQKSTVLGAGDDAAVLNYNNNYIILSTDTMVEGIHFDLVYSPLKHIGYKSVIMGLSDIYAMNAQPSQILTSLSISNKYPIEAIEEIYQGIQIACQNYQVDLVGGDTSSSPKGLLISVTSAGTQQPDQIAYRKGAKNNDLLVVSGDLGAAYMGLLVLQREKVTFNANPDFQPDMEPYQYLIERQLKPEARKDVIQLLQEKEITPTSMIDLSDGLASDLIQLSHQSQIGFHVYENKIPIDPSTINACEEFSIIPTIAALNGGEDYELLFTISPKDYSKIENNPLVTVIGFATDTTDKTFMVASGTEQLVEIKAQGWGTQ